jgi:hypothetical protein
MLGGFMFCLAFALVVGIAAVVTPGPRPAVRGLQERKMPDGTILVLEKVTVGTTHQFEWERKQSFTDLINGNWSRKYNASAFAPGEAIVVWFSRRDPVTGKCLDLDWWLRSAAVTEKDEELDDDNAGRNTFSATSSSGMSGSRPFAPESPGTYELIVAHSAVQPLRHSGKSFRLRVYNTRNEVVAEFDIPHEIPETLPVWKPEPLPATKKVDDLDVALTALGVEPNEYQEGSRTRKRYVVKPELRVLRDGKVDDVHSLREIEFEDVFGNKGNQWDCRLSCGEPAWKLKVKLWPGESAPADPSREWSVSGVTLPQARQAELIRQTKIVKGVIVDLIAAGGGEEVVYTDTSSMVRGGSSSSMGSAWKDNFEIKIRSDRGLATTTIKCKLPHLLVRATGVDGDHRLAVRVRDDQGRKVPVQQNQAADQMVVFLQLQQDAKSVDVTFAVQEPKKVEFFIKPPAVERKAAPAESLKK